ncbi:PREDICTED: hybrid signal transduction histidine kinase D isoform X1 [Prunus dulcis]|uniref:PREDICTED: hybrid signal transduction histidine kinase D isoform X1 n=1 Tax=Prunus dulcis TaxID=3755 RepID=A0A5E4G5S8_PRUDU|nr:PREDICTED: hybrid signal transduction histidine kinase D isoform X1 [Prunus dulcis]
MLLMRMVLSGLPDALEPFIDSIEVQIDPVLPDELRSLLLSFVVSSSSSGHRGGAFSGYRGGHHGRGGGIQYYTNSGRSGGSCPSPGRCSFSAPLLPTPSPSERLVPLHRVSCQICNKLGHQALDCYQCMNNKIADTSANNHVTSDLSALKNLVPYSSSDNLYVGDGFYYEEDTLSRSS